MYCHCKSGRSQNWLGRGGEEVCIPAGKVMDDMELWPIFFIPNNLVGNLTCRPPSIGTGDSTKNGSYCQAKGRVMKALH